MNVNIIKAGLQTTIQDLGRVGYRQFGIASSGALDEYSHMLANWLVGKEKPNPTLEITHIGPILEFTQATTIGIAGAEFELFINDQPQPTNRTLQINKGDRLKFGKLKSGARAYLAFCGDLTVPPIKNSQSTNLLAHFGGHQGRALNDGDNLEVTAGMFKEQRTIATELLQEHQHNLKPKHVIIRITEGREFSHLSEPSKNLLCQSNFKITSLSNRMAIKLQGERLSTAKDISMTTSPIVPGTIQLPANGQPIITLADGQTTGGYPRVGQVISADLSLLAQLKPNDTLSFYPVSIEDAKKILLTKQGFIKNHLQK